MTLPAGNPEPLFEDQARTLEQADKLRRQLRRATRKQATKLAGIALGIALHWPEDDARTIIERLQSLREDGENTGHIMLRLNPLRRRT